MTEKLSQNPREGEGGGSSLDQFSAPLAPGEGTSGRLLPPRSSFATASEPRGVPEDLPRLGVLASGSGTILRAVLESGLDVAAVVVDRDCPAVQIAVGAGVAVEVVERETFGPEFDRMAYTGRIVEALKRHQIDVVAMAGFGTVL
ncbi:MAG: hypothetical protein JO337_02120, partial [Acidimicrobiales bacterium]|nr:hypothetical protein [Acidimicrobiales bacterium]